MKEQLRKEMLRKRDSHHSGGGHVLCISIMDRFLRLPQFNSANLLLLYASKGSEVHTDGIIMSALSLGKRLALPRTDKEARTLELYEIKSISELEKGAFGIPEPKPIAERRVQPEQIELAVVPGISFDSRGHRLGYGMGYYDSLLKKVPGSKIGLAYDFQLVDRVPEEPHDIAVDVIVTENQTIDCTKNALGADGGREKGGEGRNAVGGGMAGGKGGSGRNPSEGGKEFRVVVLCSGRGTDFQSMIDGVAQGKVNAQIVGMITDNPTAGAIERAKKAGVPVFAMQLKGEELDGAIKKKLDELQPDLVVLAGYMKIIRSKELLSSYRGRIINIHPSLLPAYPGAHAQRDAFEAGEKISGYTIHFVDETLDGGRIIHQEKVDISGCKGYEEAAARILEREHVGLPLVVDNFARGKYADKTPK
jgi:phosphoribosylglycinamide formyltransferase-1